MKAFSKEELKEKFTNIQKAFKSFDKIELKGRKHIQEAILGCYDIYLHYNPKLIKKRCTKAGIEYKVKKPMKMILMLALGVSDKCDDERVKARIRTYVRVLKRFDSLSFDLDAAEKNLGQYGIDYFANFRSSNQNDTEGNEEDNDDDDDKQPELPFGDDDENTEEDDEDEDEADDDIDEDDNNNTDAKTPASESQKQSLGDKTVKFFQSNNIKDKNYVIWVNGNNVYKSTDIFLLQKLNVSKFKKL
ncbi:unknown [Acetobacter sp. CAG:267]|nr:unknown [Acetobacter sp. CAG:267]